MTDETPAIVYLTSHYPALSQPFIEREIAAVRTRGFRIFTATVRPFEEADLRSEVMRTEASRTQVLIGAGTRAWLPVVAHRCQSLLLAVCSKVAGSSHMEG